MHYKDSILYKFLLKNFEFTACHKNTYNFANADGRFSFDDLNININPHYIDTSVYKVFKNSIFEIDVVQISDNANLPYTCTLFLTEDHRMRISIIGNPKFCKSISKATNGDEQCFGMVIFDATLLESYCFELLRGSSSRNFITNIDIFKVKE